MGKILTSGLVLLTSTMLTLGTLSPSAGAAETSPGDTATAPAGPEATGSDPSIETPLPDPELTPEEIPVPIEPSADEPPTPEEALATATRAVEGEARSSDPDLSIAMRDLALARTDLDDRDLAQADSLLARPTDLGADIYGNGYTTPYSSRLCGAHVCVHYVTSTSDAPPNLAWVQTTLNTMETVWVSTVNKMGYRAPLSDGTRGGDGRLDVYLKNLAAGAYGYCAPEPRGPGVLATSYCVLDNDFAPGQFRGQPALTSLRATAAHEFFHAVQCAYDYTEDRWFMESTATWMEERVFDDVNDNRQYLRSGQLAAPWIPLDLYYNSVHYGNWIFWEYLSTRFGNNIVRNVWNRAGNRSNPAKVYSTLALRRELDKRAKFSRVYGDFIAAITRPGKYFPEGSAYAANKPGRTIRMTRKRGTRALRVRLDHLTGRSLRVIPKNLKKKRVKLRVQISGKAAAATVLIVQKNGKVKRKTVKVKKSGHGSVRVRFSSKKVRYATVAVANASTRFHCWQRSSYSCQGLSKDDGRIYKIRLKVLR